MSNIVKIKVNGKEIAIEQRGQVKEWGSFFDWLTILWDEYDVKRKAEANPYKQYVLNEQKSIIVEMRRSYQVFVETIGNRHIIDIDDIARPYLQTVEAKIHAVKETSLVVVKDTTIRDPNEVQKPDYIGASYRGQLKVLKQILNQFKGFTLQP